MDMVTMRVFDALACGAFVLAEYSDDLARLFEIGTEVESYATLEQLIEKVQHYLDNPAEARTIAYNGRARVLRDHTIAQRLDTMLTTAGLE
ncbi:MAG TPA: glycosyltransferase family 1 protein [Gemmatimonadetes bacterium]|nr:glycosyltransferase family 1 protein [Gemmatimonadota bacterium]